MTLTVQDDQKSVVFIKEGEKCRCITVTQAQFDQLCDEVDRLERSSGCRVKFNGSYQKYMHSYSERV